MCHWASLAGIQAVDFEAEIKAVLADINDWFVVSDGGNPDKSCSPSDLFDFQEDIVHAASK